MFCFQNPQEGSRANITYENILCENGHGIVSLLCVYASVILLVVSQTGAFAPEHDKTGFRGCVETLN